MVARSEKKSAADLCTCKHWRDQHDRFGCFHQRGCHDSCRCPGFTPAVHPAELTKGARS